MVAHPARHILLPVGLASCCSGSSSLSCRLSDNISLMDRTLDNLLFFGIEVLREVFVQRGLFLLELCCRLVISVNDIQCERFDTYGATRA